MGRAEARGCGLEPGWGMQGPELRQGRGGHEVAIGHGLVRALGGQLTLRRKVQDDHSPTPVQEHR